MIQNDDTYSLRTKDLVARVKEANSEITKGLIILFAGFEDDKHRFVQESTFYYYTGLQEPSVVLTIDLNGYKTLYVPNCLEERSKWVSSMLETTSLCAQKIGVNEIKLLGDRCSGYQLYPYSGADTYKALTSDLNKKINEGSTLFALHPSAPYGYIEQRLLLQRIKHFGTSFEVQDISSIVAAMRRAKDMQEIELIYKAIEITAVAQESAARAIEEGVNEAEVQAALEYVMIASQSEIAFPSIVATGKNTTVLHYSKNNAELKNGDLIVVDIGARYQGYCADITRTYPVSGKFSERQKEIYNLVLETQEYIASLAKPGMWLSNSEHPETSLNHLAHNFLKEKGYDQYFYHGIGHYLGLDVHDVGAYTEPLKEGDIITIEPGIYIAQENLGVRIEDNYWIVKDGSVCLSEGLPKICDDVEQMVQEKFA